MGRPQTISKGTKLFTCICGKSRILWISDRIPKMCVKCHLTQIAKKNFFKHGKSYDSEYKAWFSMNAACYNKNSLRYERCGAVNITVCDEWLGENGLLNFYKDMGKKPQSFKRIILGRLDYSENFTPKNCKWMNLKEANTYGRLNR